MRLLIVEDDDRAARYLLRGLTESGHVVDHTADGETGLALALEGIYDALIVDRRLPALDGNLKGWLAVIDELSRMKARFVVPGHGSLTADLEVSLIREREYLTALYDGVRSELAQGQSMQDAIGKVAVAERDRWALWEDVHPRNVARAYEELQWE